MKRIVATGVTALLVWALLPAGSAFAETRSASDCLRMFDSDSNAYYREGWQTDEVAVATTRDGTILTLRCGNELSGVIHIADPESTGTGHSLNPSGADDAVFATCFRKTVTEGTPRDESDRVLLVRNYGPSGGRSYVRYGRDGTVYSMYTSAPGDEWADCAR
jgi:hypothetical protein